MAKAKVPGGKARGKGAAGAGGAAGGKGKGAGGKGKGKGKGKKKDKMKCGESGSYGDLKKKTGGGKFDRDHVPSKGALKRYAQDEVMGGKKLCKLQKAAVDKIGNTIAIPKGVHSGHSPTYGGLNTDKRIGEDAADLQKAAKRDTANVSKGMKDPCKKKYQAWAKKVNKMTNDDYYKMLDKAIKPFKKK